MADLVVTVPARLWADWLAEGDLPGDPPTGETWRFYTGGRVPTRLATRGERVWSLKRELYALAVEPDQRCYVVAHGRLRGWAPITAIEVWAGTERLSAIVRRAGAVAVTIPGEVPGFQGWRYRWWERGVEVAFPGWQTEGVR